MPHSSSRCLGFKLCSSPEVRFRAPLRVPQKHPLQLNSSAVFQSEGGPNKKFPMLTGVQRCVKRTLCSQGHFFLKKCSKEPYARFHFCKETHIPRRGIFTGKPHFHYTICSQRPDWYILSPVGCSPSMVTIDLKRTLYSGCQN